MFERLPFWVQVLLQTLGLCLTGPIFVAFIILAISFFPT